MNDFEAPLPTPPEPSPVVRAFGGTTVGYECPTCKNIFRVFPSDPYEKAKELAAQCCGPWHCEKHNRTIQQRWSCSECSRDVREEHEAKQFASAKKISLAEYDGSFLYREGCELGRDDFFPVDEAGDEAAPAWAFACTPKTVSEDACDLADHIAESILADHHKEAYEYADVAKIEQASKLVFEACKDITTHEPDHSIVVILKAEAAS